MSRLAPTQAEKSPVKRIPRPSRINGCDRCGYSSDGSVIAYAKYEIEVPGGSIFLCGSHTRRHIAHILEKNYDMTPTGV